MRTLQCTKSLILYLFCPLKFKINLPSKVGYNSIFEEISLTVLTIKTATNWKSILEICLRMPLSYSLWTLLNFVLISVTSVMEFCIPYARHYNPLLIWNRSWILTIHKIRILRKKLLKNKIEGTPILKLAMVKRL